MSAERTRSTRTQRGFTRLACDVRDCRTTSVDGNTAAAARATARELGWDHVDHRDLCPTHQPTPEPKEPTMTRKTKATIPAWLILRTDWTTYRAAPLWTFSVLALHADRNDEVTISVQQLAETMDTEPRTISRHLAVLRDMGAITTRRPGVTQANTYTLHMEGPATAAAVTSGAEL